MVEMLHAVAFQHRKPAHVCKHCGYSQQISTSNPSPSCVTNPVMQLYRTVFNLDMRCILSSYRHWCPFSLILPSAIYVIIFHRDLFCIAESDSTPRPVHEVCLLKASTLEWDLKLCCQMHVASTHWLNVLSYTAAMHSLPCMNTAAHWNPQIISSAVYCLSSKQKPGHRCM